MYTCPFHRIQLNDIPCSQCMADWKELPDPSSMSPEQKARELECYTVLTVEWPMLWDRIDALVGRSTNMPFDFIRGGIQRLVEEIRAGDRRAE